MKERSSGILLPISSLPSRYGIGTFGKEAFDFVDFLKKSGQKYWQILPLGTTSYGDSPYQSFSAFAGNHDFIDLEELISDGLLEKEYVDSIDFGSNESYINYERLFNTRLDVLKTAYENGKERYFDELNSFIDENLGWIVDYALFMAIKKDHDLLSWTEWKEDFKNRDYETLEKYKLDREDDLRFWYFTQFLFYKQWHALKSYANDMGIYFIGDIPIYIAEDSADSWSHPDLFIFNENRKPKVVAGCPPDAFSATGQLWGNPIYDWKKMEEHGFKWWIERMRASYELYDVIRIDHFRGFESYWEIPAEDDTAEFGKWVKGPGMSLFNAIRSELGELDIIAEDLGFMTDEVVQLVKDSGFPNMKVLQFAFDAREESDYLPHTYNSNCVVYTGTHDNDTVIGWSKVAQPEELAYAKEYLHIGENEDLAWGFIRGAFASVAYLAVVPMQDILTLDESSRINTPSTLGGNWEWRMKKEDYTEDLAEKLFNLTWIYRRTKND